MKRFFISCCSAAIILCSCNKDKSQDTTPTADELLFPSSGKMMHYLFNNSLRDTSGNGKHGGEANDITYAADRFGRAGRAVSFNGTSSHFEGKGMRVDFPFAVSFWMKTATPLATATLFKSEKNPGDPGLYTGYWFQTLATGPYTLAFNFGDGTGYSVSSRNSLLSNKTLAANQWYHIVVNVTGANNMELYINAVKDNTAVYDGAATSIFYSYADPSAPIGQGFPGQYFNGQLDDLRVYNRILTTTEITSLFSFTP